MSIGTQWRFDAGVLAWDPIPLAREKRVLLFFPECQDCHRWSPVFDAPWELTISLKARIRSEASLKKTAKKSVVTTKEIPD